MKRRNFFLALIPLALAGLICLALALLWIQRAGFQHVYLTEEKEEIENHLAMMSLFFQPLLDANDLETLDRFCDTFAFDQRSIAILNLRSEAVAASGNAPLGAELLNNPESIQAKKSGKGIDVRLNPHNGVWTVYAAAMITSRGKPLIVHLTIPAATVSESLQSSSQWMLRILIGGLAALLFISWHLIWRVARPLNRLQNSAERIAAGELNFPVDVPPGGAVRDLAVSIESMANQLKEKLEQAKKQERFQREFIANVSHEVKTPLTAILSSVELLQEEPQSETVKKRCIEILLRQANRLNLLIQDILNLAKLEQKQESKPNFTPFNLADAVKSAVELCSESAKEKGVLIAIPRVDSITISADFALIEQAAVNLIQNAIKYSQSEKIEVSVLNTNETAGIIVRDFGVGIAPEDAARVFERFYRGKQEYSRPESGSGLGLAIVKSIAALHGGSVALNLAVSPGCQFEITLPKN